MEAVRRALPETGRTAAGLERITVITAARTEDVTRLLTSLRADPRVEYVEAPRFPLGRRSACRSARA